MLGLRCAGAAPRNADGATYPGEAPGRVALHHEPIVPTCAASTKVKSVPHRGLPGEDGGHLKRGSWGPEPHPRLPGASDPSPSTPSY